MFIHNVIVSYLGFGQPPLQFRLITLLLATWFICVYITLDGSNFKL